MFLAGSLFAREKEGIFDGFHGIKTSIDRLCKFILCRTNGGDNSISTCNLFQFARVERSEHWGGLQKKTKKKKKKKKKKKNDVHIFSICRSI